MEMSCAHEVLSAMPQSIRFGVDELAAAIEGCATAARACTSCADACLAEDDVPAMRACIASNQNCAEVCGTTARSRTSGWLTAAIERRRRLLPPLSGAIGLTRHAAGNGGLRPR
jgi:hypothetical protein